MRILAAFVALASATACAPTGPPVLETQSAGASAPRPCFRQSQISNFRQGETKTAFIRVMRRDVYEITAGGCLDLDSATALTVTPDLRSGQRLCVGDRVRLAASGPSTFSMACLGRITRQLTEAEIKALPSRQRP